MLARETAVGMSVHHHFTDGGAFEETMMPDKRGCIAASPDPLTSLTTDPITKLPGILTLDVPASQADSAHQSLFCNLSRFRGVIPQGGREPRGEILSACDFFIDCARRTHAA